MTKIDLSLIIPCYNEGPTFSKSVEVIISVLKKLKENWEIILVEDKSIDKTKKTVLSFEKKYKNIRTIYHKKNLGRGKSVTDGILAAKGEICGYLDVDLEVSANYISLFIKEIKAGNDLVVGKRFYEGEGIGTIPRFLASKIYAATVKWLLKCSIEDTESGYKFFRTKKIIPILGKIKSKHWFWDTEICVISQILGLRIEQVPVLFIRRDDKKSTVRLIGDTIDYIKNLIRFRKEMSELEGNNDT